MRALRALAASLLLLATSETGLAAEKKKILLVDGYANWIIYNATRKGGKGTNIDDLSDALKDICNILLYSEIVHQGWARHEQVSAYDIDLVIVHISAFNTQTINSPSGLPEPGLFPKSMSKSRAKYIVYTRAETSSFNKDFVTKAIGGLDRANDLRIIDNIPRTREGFPDPATKDRIKMAIKELIAVETRCSDISN